MRYLLVLFCLFACASVTSAEDIPGIPGGGAGVQPVPDKTPPKVKESLKPQEIIPMPGAEILFEPEPVKVRRNVRPQVIKRRKPAQVELPERKLVRRVPSLNEDISTLAPPAGSASKTGTEEALPAFNSVQVEVASEPAQAITEEDVSKFRMSDVLATVGGKPFRRAELYDAMSDVYGKKVFERIVNVMLLKNEVKRKRIVISRAEIDTSFGKHMQKLNGDKPMPRNWHAYLKRTTGMSEKEYKDRVVWVELALRKLVSASMPINDQDLYNYYWPRRGAYTEPAKVRVQQIFINPLNFAENKGNDSSKSAGMKEWKQAEGLISMIAKKSQGGADFATLVRRYSHDRESAAKGGDSGYFHKGMMLKPFEDAAFSLKKPGQVSRPIKTILGYYIIRLTDRKAEQVRAFNSVKDKVREDYNDYIFMSQSVKLLQQLKSRALKNGELRILDNDLKN